MQTEKNMNKIRLISKIGKTLGALILLVFAYSNAHAQCSITVTNSPCVGEPVSFECGTVGASNFNWNFNNGEGFNTSQCNPTFTFSSAGSKTVTLTLKLANGNTCNATATVVVKPKPIINIKRIVSKTQCFAGNSFCFTDSSKSGDPGGNICNTKVVFDDGTQYTFSGNGPRTFCHKFGDPSGGDYGMTVEVEDCNGCITKQYIPSVAKVFPSLGLTFSSPRPQACNTVTLCVTNNSAVPFDSIKNFTWDWGDGSTTSGVGSNPADQPKWKTVVCKTFTVQGPNGGSFNTKLTVTTNFGCTESFTFNSSATNLIIKPIIVASRDSVCTSDKQIDFRLLNGPIPLGGNPTWNFGNPPSGPLNIVRQWQGTHAAWGRLGPYRVSFSWTHQIGGCAGTVFDTILHLGPQSTIEKPFDWLIDSLRFQCTIKDTVKFKNFSTFYHNDKNMIDDDKTLIIPGGFNSPLEHEFVGQNPAPNPGEKRGNECTIRVWDFDDDFCEKCTTDTKKGINVGKNCKYSKDSLPQHWYTPWDEIYMRREITRPVNITVFNQDSFFCVSKRLWAYDSAAIILDTTLYYGDNGLGNKSKDSSVFASITKKVKVAWGVQGPAKFVVNVGTRVWIPAGDTLFVDPNNGLPEQRWIPGVGQSGRYVTIAAGNSLWLKSATDKVLYSYWLDIRRDTIPKFMVDSLVWKKLANSSKVKNPQFQLGDSINPESHRQKFFSSSTVRCFNVRLYHKDICHPMACDHEAIAQLALQPPSAKKLRKEGVQCLGGAQQNYGITFILEDTKPSCSRTWAEINYDTALNINGWNNLIAPNLGGGAVPTGNLPPANPPYLGYAIGGAPGGRYSKQFTVNDIKDTITGYINVGLIVGTGMWTNNLNNGINPNTYGYPTDCHDTVYYHKFARFPILDNNFRIIKPKEGVGFTKICRKDTICLTTNAWNRTYIPDVAEATWSLEAANAGKYFNQYYRLSVVERYDRFKAVAGNSSILEDFLTITKSSFFDGNTNVISTENIKIATVKKWHTEADITPVFDIIKTILEANNIDIYELTPGQLNELIWNGVGTINQPYTGSKGCLDTTGFGRFIRFYKVADEKESLHDRDTSLIPVDSIVGWDGKVYKSYCFVPQYSGYYIANFGLRSIAPENCNKTTGTAKKVIVGYYSELNYSDTIICHGTPITATPQFRYFEVFPEIFFRVLDPTDWWRQRIGEAGNPNREAPTKWDLNKDDDDITNPATIFGGFPYAQSGLGNPTVTLGGIAGGIYYLKDTGYNYLIRVASGDSAGCKDTIPQDIYVTAVRAKFGLDLERPQCNGILEFFDSSYVIDPCKPKLGTECDKIVEWIINWGDNASNSRNRFLGQLPPKIGHDYTKNGKFWVTLTVKTQLGCVDVDSIEVYIPGPIPFFDTFIPKKYCVNDLVVFKNLSKYNKLDSSIWAWEFGDGTVKNQYDTLTPTTDTVSHRYPNPGKYSVKLSQTFKLRIGNSTRSCTVVYPDTRNGQDSAFIIEIFAPDTTKLIGPTEACIGDSVKFDGSVIPFDRYNNYKWSFGRNGADTLITPDTTKKLAYNTPGRYVVRFKGDINTANSTKKICPGEDSLVIIVGDVEANFEIDSTKKPLFCFNNTSKNNAKNKWSFYVPNSNIQNPNAPKVKPKVFNPDGNSSDYDKAQICEDYRDSLGSYWVCLEVENAFGCTDTICKIVYNDFQALILPPNVFTPNTDAFLTPDQDGNQGNNVFNIVIKGQEMYDLVIYDRWGVKVFESTDPSKDWNGNVNNTGGQCSDGTYYYILKYRYKGKTDDEKPINGVVRIIR